jgi:hypothetical protein
MFPAFDYLGSQFYFPGCRGRASLARKSRNMI